MDNKRRDRLAYLINRSIHQEETHDERKELDYLLGDHTSFQDLDSMILESFYKPKSLDDLPQEKQEQILQSIYEVAVTAERPITIRKYWKWVGIAAASILAIFMLWLPHTDEKTDDQITLEVQPTAPDQEIPTEESIVESQFKNDREPASQTATLTLYDGTSFRLNELKSDEIVRRAGLIISKNENGVLVLNFSKPDKLSSKVRTNLNRIETPRGGSFEVILTDGTTVSLNAGSTLWFPSEFEPDNRSVTFTGEGFFSVAKDNSRRFTVHVKGNKRIHPYRIEVYGTEFNVNAFNEENEATTTLVSGSVRLYSESTGKAAFLSPSQQAVYNERGLEITPADIEANLAWRNNLFYFQSASLREVMAQISRWYDIDVNYADDLPDTKVWGQISRTKKLSELLEILEKTNDISFNIRGKEVEVMR